MPAPSSPTQSSRAVGPATPEALVVLFAGGGTGGHLFPNLAVAEALRDLVGERASFRFLCSARPIDASILTAEGAAFTPVPASPPTLRPLGLLRFLRGWAPSVREGRSRIREARRGGARVVVVASGGFVAAPVVQAARVERCPVIMLNLDAVPGRANRWIARHAARILTTAPVRSAPSGPRRVDWEPIPPIVRREAMPPASPQECRRALGMNPGLPTLLVTGGSQGATSINRMMMALVRERAEALAGWQVVHQAGGAGVEAEQVALAYREAGVPAHVVGFLSPMGRAWGAADLCVCRAGAGNVGEAWATRTPCLFMPYPYHKDEHQRANAQPLADKGAALLARDEVDPERNLAGAGASLVELLAAPGARQRLRDGLASLGPADGAARVARAVVDVAQGHAPR